MVHPSQSLAAVCAVFIVGLGISSFEDRAGWICGAALFGLVLWRLGTKRMLMLVAVGIGCAFLRLGPGQEHVAVIPKEKIGLVVDQPQFYTDHVRVVVRLEGGQRWAANVKNRFLMVGMGDRVQFSCENGWEGLPMLQAWNVVGGCEVWDVEVVQQAKPPLSWLTAMRSRMKASIRRVFPEPAAALVIGMTIGEEGGLPDDLRQDFRDVGLTHLVALSGYNITLLFGWMAKIAGMLVVRPKSRVVLLLAGGAVFLAFIGWQPSLMRATVMGSLAAVGASMGRKHLTIHMLLLAATIMALNQPTILGSIGFLLSAGSTLGLLLWAESATGWWERIGMPKLVAEPLGLTSAAMVAVSPILVGIFGQAAPAALPANLLAGPLVPVIMTGGLVGLMPDELAPVFVPVPYVAATAVARIATIATYIPNPFHAIGPWPIQPHWYGYLLIILLLWIELKPQALSCSSFSRSRGA